MICFLGSGISPFIALRSDRNAHVKKSKIIKNFLGETDKIGSVNVYEKIVREARQQNLAGATVYRGIMGFGKNSRIHTSKILRLSEDLPLVIEIVDEAKKIEDFIPVIEEILDQANSGALVTVEKAEIIKYSTSKNKSS